MKRRHIVLVANDIGGVGGMEKHLEEMIQRMKKDYAVTVVSSSFRVKDPSGVRFIKIPAIRRPFPLMIAMFSVLASIRLWFMRDSIIHTTGAIVFHRVDVSTIHFCHAGYINGVVTDSRQGKTLFHRINARLSLSLKLWTEEFCYRPYQTSKLVAVSSRIQQELETFYSYPAGDIEVIPNGVDIQQFHPNSSVEKRRIRKDKGLPDEGTFLIFMGGDWERKGLRLLLGAFNMLAGEHSSLHLVVVGDGDVKSFMYLVEPMFRERVHFVGRQSDPEVWYGLADIFVFPSQYEACSLAVLEAAACGLAMVLTDVGGARDVIENGVSGCIVELSEVDIARAINVLLQDPATMNVLGQLARTRVESMTWDDTYRRFQAVYDRLTARPAQPSKPRVSMLNSNNETQGAANHA